MNYSGYFCRMQERFDGEQPIEETPITRFFLQKERARWRAVHPRTFVHLHYAEQATALGLQFYSTFCTDYTSWELDAAIDPFRDGCICLNILAVDFVDAPAIRFATACPPKHLGITEIPILADLRNEQLYFYEKTPFWCLAHNRHIRKFIKTKLLFRP